MVIVHREIRGGDHRVPRRVTDDEIGRMKNQTGGKQVSERTCEGIYVATAKLRNLRFTHNERVSRIHRRNEAKGPDQGSCRIPDRGEGRSGVQFQCPRRRAYRTYDRMSP